MDQVLLRKRAQILQNIRRFFYAAGYLEVDTPLLAPFVIPESTIEVFSTRYVGPAGADQELYLLPSPELWMKRLLADGSGSIFQICRCFRNREPMSPLHQVEFTMLEWYTQGADYLDSIAVLEQLIVSLLDSLQLSAEIAWQGQNLCFTPPFPRLRMAEAFRSIIGLNLDNLPVSRLYQAAIEMDVNVSEKDSWADIFHKLFLVYIEPELPQDRPLILIDYPAAISTLAKNDGMWSERWELYIAGVEVANCYSEETDPAAVNRFTGGESKRIARTTADPDLAAVSGRMPECSGVALGIDRLLLFLLGQNNLAGVNFFPIFDRLHHK